MIFGYLCNGTGQRLRRDSFESGLTFHPIRTLGTLQVLRISLPRATVRGGATTVAVGFRVGIPEMRMIRRGYVGGRGHMTGWWSRGVEGRGILRVLRDGPLALEEDLGRETYSGGIDFGHMRIAGSAA